MDRDEQMISAQLGRELQGKSEVRSICHLGLPVVIAVPPVLDDGTPFPTRYWLTCPLATRRIGRLESGGEIKRLNERARLDVEFGVRLEAAHNRYRQERDALIPDEAEHRPRGGVAGAEAGVKCLHAHYADHAARNDNPVGEAVATSVEPLDCAVPCVIDGQRNPAWREPQNRMNS